MVHITDPDDIGGEIKRTTRVIPIDKSDDDLNFDEQRLFFHNEFWKTNHTFPENFTDMDKTIAMDLLNYGETTWDRPAEIVMEWVDMIMKNRKK